jgi:uncharacterized membrane-anchored protein
VERNLSVHEITTDRRERFYWAAVMTTFALGTAAGDLTATSLGLGYLGSGFLFLTVFALPGLVFVVTRRAAVALFWIAYVMTRPLGASFADWAAVPPYLGGLGLGAGTVSAALLVVFAVVIAVLSRRARAARVPGARVALPRRGEPA